MKKNSIFGKRDGGELNYKGEKNNIHLLSRNYANKKRWSEVFEALREKKKKHTKLEFYIL